MKLAYKNGITSVVLRVKITDSTTGNGKTGLDHTASGLIISTIADNEATATAYTSTNLETITTLGTFAAPTGGKARFKKVDDTNHPGVYEVQIADARWAVSGARSVIVSVLGVADTLQYDTEVQLEPVPADALRIEGADASDTIEAAVAAALVDLGAEYWDAQLLGLTTASPLGGGNMLVTYMEPDGVTPKFDVSVDTSMQRFARNLY